MNESQTVTFEQKMRAFELAMDLLQTDGPAAGSSQKEFNEHMDDYLSVVAGFASVIFQKIDSVALPER